MTVAGSITRRWPGWYVLDELPVLEDLGDRRRLAIVARHPAGGDCVWAGWHNISKCSRVSFEDLEVALAAWIK